MPEYLSPGVYIEEFEIGARPIEGVSTSTAGFLGETQRGPTKPRLITSWLNFQRVYGSYFKVDGRTPYLPYAVEGFFSNGGKRCYIGRITPGDAGLASGNLQSGGSDALTVEALGEGPWGSNIALIVGPGTFSTTTTPLFKLRVFYWKNGLPTTLGDPDADSSIPTPTIRETFDDLSVDSESPNYYENKVNGISNLITIKQDTAAGDTGALPDGPNTVTALTGGTAGTTPLTENDYKRDSAADDVPGKRKGLTAFKEIDEISIVYVPDVTSVSTSLAQEIITHCETLKDRFAIIDAPINSSDSNAAALNPRNDLETKYGAYYYPWIKIIDPLTQLGKLIPPGGHTAGIYARTDVERGVHKAPANEKVRGATDLEFAITNNEQDILNPRGVNCIRAFPGRGIRVWGARTLSSDTLWKYINVRRLFNFIEESIEEGTQWVVFEPNNENLWARVVQTITQFLTRVWRDGALMGTAPEEAFFVKCDRTTMTQDDIDNGRLICIIGIAPVKPAEFVIFRIAQWQGGSEVSEEE